MRKPRSATADRFSPGGYAVVAAYALVFAGTMYLYHHPPEFAAALTRDRTVGLLWGVANEMNWRIAA